MFNSILDGLTYKDLAGKRQPRAFTVLAGVILLVVSMAGGLAFLNRLFLMSKVQATPVPVSLTSVPTQIVETVQPTQQTVEIWDGCPTDPGDWGFSPTYSSQTFSVIQPACVYQGLEKTIAWALAVREGYSRADATQLLGFTDTRDRRAAGAGLHRSSRNGARAHAVRLRLDHGRHALAWLGGRLQCADVGRDGVKVDLDPTQHWVRVYRS
jgi:hypothetical protein